MSAANAVALQGRDLVVFSNDWDGDPLSKVHIMRILSKENRVLWVNSIGNRKPRANAHDAKRLFNKLTSFTQGIQNVEPNIYVLSPLALPFFGNEWVRATNGSLLRAQVTWAMKRLGFRRPISWSFLPASAPVSGSLGEEFVVYHCVDEFSEFSDTKKNEISELEKRLLKKADLCITSAEALRDNKVKYNSRTVLVTHGVDFEHFVKACAPETEVPSDLARLPRPILGFFGLLADWVDFEAVKACAQAWPQGSVVLLGKLAPDADVSALKGLSNVHFLGRKPYSQLPAYCKGFDVALLPFKQNELTKNANPLKVREYLAAGLPVAATDLPEVRRLGMCHLAKTTNDFPAAVQACLDEGAGCSKSRADRIAHESWNAKVKDIRSHVALEMRRRGLLL